MTSCRADRAAGAAAPPPGLYTRRRFVELGGAAAAAFAIGGCAGVSGTAAATSAVQTRTIQDGRGEVVIPANPQRVVALEGMMNFFLLGVPPVGSRNMEREVRNHPELAAELGTIFDLGGQELNIEEVLALTPDVIFATTPNRDDIYGQLSQIAPTVMHARGGADRKHRWAEGLEFYGKALGKEQQAADMLDAYRARLADLADGMGERLASTRVSVLRVGSDNLRVYTRGSFSGGVLQDAGIARPPNQDLDAFQTEALTNGEQTEGFEISPERLREADGDVIFLVVPVAATPEEDTDQTKLTRANAQAVTDNPLWNQLGAVRNGQAFEVGGHWNGETILDAEKMLDDLDLHLLKV